MHNLRTRASLAALLVLAIFLALTTAAVANEPYSPQQITALEIAQSHIQDHLDEFGLAPDDVGELRISDLYTSSHNSVAHVYFQQQRHGIDVYGALINVNVLPDSQVLNAGNRAWADLAGRRLAGVPAIRARQALDEALRTTDLVAGEPIERLVAPTGAQQHTEFFPGGVAIEPISARLVYAPDDERRLHLAWQIEIHERGAEHYWVVFVEAADGEVIRIEDRVIHDPWGQVPEHCPAPARPAASPPPTVVESAATRSTITDGSSYHVFALPTGNPDEGPRSLVSEPAHAPASPFGWHDTNGADGAEYTITRGNNVHAYQDCNDSDYSSGDEPAAGMAQGRELLGRIDQAGLECPAGSMLVHAAVASNLHILGQIDAAIEAVEAALALIHRTGNPAASADR